MQTKLFLLWDHQVLMTRSPKLLPESMQRLLKHKHWWQWVSQPSFLMKKMVLTKGTERFYNPGLSLQRWYNFLIAESGWKWPRDTPNQSTSHGCLTCSGGMNTILLAACPYLQEGKSRAKSWPDGAIQTCPGASLELHLQQTQSVHILM